VELGNAPASSDRCLTVAGISHVFTIACVAQMLAVDEKWLDELSLRMDPEDGRLWVICTPGEQGEGIVAFTELGIENLRQLIADSRI
jgi:hypothetical protein